MAPPKRKTTGGRVTPKGTRPGQIISAPAANPNANASSRYTPPTPKSYEESPRWVPILMAVLIGLGVLTIILRYIVWDSNTAVLVGLVFLLSGLFVATKWK
jgi:hypothetical protein